MRRGYAVASMACRSVSERVGARWSHEAHRALEAYVMHEVHEVHEAHRALENTSACIKTA